MEVYFYSKNRKGAIYAYLCNAFYPVNYLYWKNIYMDSYLSSFN